MKIKVSTVSVKKTGEKNGKTWTISTITTEDGNTYDTFDTLEVGKEYEGEAKPNPPYTDNFSLTRKSGGFPKKDYTFEKRRVALECATSLMASGMIKGEHLIATRDKFFEYLNQ